MILNYIKCSLFGKIVIYNKQGKLVHRQAVKNDSNNVINLGPLLEIDELNNLKIMVSDWGCRRLRNKTIVFMNNGVKLGSHKLLTKTLPSENITELFDKEVEIETNKEWLREQQIEFHRILNQAIE